MSNLNVNLAELLQGENYCTITSIRRNEKRPEFIEINVRSSELTTDILRIYDDSSNSEGMIRKLIFSTIYKKGVTQYNLKEIEGKDVIIDIEKATSKSGNTFWKVKGFSKVDSSTDLSKFKFINELNINKPEEVEDISELEDLLDK
ncbi:MAG: hypothetical protein ACLUDK_14250 [Clostridium paraputrificum]